MLTRTISPRTCTRCVEPPEDSRMRMVSILVMMAGAAAAQQKPRPPPGCDSLPDHARLRAALQAIVKEGKEQNTGMGNQEWAAVVNRDGLVCAIVFSGPDRSVQWPGSRVIA